MISMFNEVCLVEGRSKASQSHFEYLESSARPEAVDARRTVDRWFCRYPEKHRHSLRQRFRSSREVDHTAAYFELAIHELLLLQGARQIVVEPTMPNVETSPDFEVTWQDGSRTYVEATCATGLSDRGRAMKRNEEALIDKVREARSSDFHIELHILTDVVSLDGVRTVKREIESFLQSLDFDEVAAGFRHRLRTFGGVEQRFSKTIARPGFQIEVSAIPVGERRGTEEACLAFWHSANDAGYSSTQDDIRAAIDEKSSRYGDLDCAYVIAVNVFEWGLSRRDVVHALLGTETVKWIIDTASGATVQTDLVYGRDGALGTPVRQARRNVSAIVCANHWTAWTSPERKLYTVHNPWADRPLLSNLNAGCQIRFGSNGNSIETGEPDVTSTLRRE